MAKVILYAVVFLCSLFSLAISQFASGSKKAPEPRFLGLGLLGGLFSEVTVSGTYSPSGGHKPGKRGKPGKPGKPGKGDKGGKKGGHRGGYKGDDDDYSDYYDGGGVLEDLVESWIG